MFSLIKKGVKWLFTKKTETTNNDNDNRIKNIAETNVYNITYPILVYQLLIVNNQIGITFRNQDELKSRKHFVRFLDKR